MARAADGMPTRPIDGNAAGWPGTRAPRLVPALVVGAALLAPIAAWWAHRTWGLALPPGGWTLGWALLVAPIVEELLFRSLQDEIARWIRACRPAAVQRTQTGEWTAAAFVTAVFVAVHAGHVPDAPLHLVAWVAPGAALALMWTWRRSRLDCIALHAYFNGCLWLAGAA